MNRVEFEQILDNSRKLLEKITKVEEILGTEINSLCHCTCNIIDVLSGSTKAIWDDDLWTGVYNYNISTSELTTEIEKYSIAYRESNGEREVKIFDEE